METTRLKKLKEIHQRRKRLQEDEGEVFSLDDALIKLETNEIWEDRPVKIGALSGGADVGEGYQEQIWSEKNYPSRPKLRQ